MSSRAKVLEYGVSLDREWTARSDRGGAWLAIEDAWSPEHLLLAALARCTLTSLDYHARRAGTGARSSAEAKGRVTRREADGRYAFVEVDVTLDVVFETQPENVRELLAKAERDCFIGASLSVTPRYSWIVDGQEVG